MHYRVKGCDVDIDKVDEFISLAEDEGYVCEELEGEIELSREDVDEENTRVILLTRGDK